MNNYGYIKENGTTPSDNVWTEGREIILNDDSIVYGYEGEDSEVDGVVVMTQKEFNNWTKENLKQEDIAGT